MLNLGRKQDTYEVKELKHRWIKIRFSWKITCSWILPVFILIDTNELYMGLRHIYVYASFHRIQCIFQFQITIGSIEEKILQCVCQRKPNWFDLANECWKSKTHTAKNIEQHKIHKIQCGHGNAPTVQAISCVQRFLCVTEFFVLSR